jgi:hypothetical protein
MSRHGIVLTSTENGKLLSTLQEFEGGPLLNVPGDFNTQMPELTYIEETVWYKKTFLADTQNEIDLIIKLTFK